MKTPATTTIQASNDSVKGEHKGLEQVSGDSVSVAIAKRDWMALRRLSLLPGGFGDRRSDVWPFLLHARPRDEHTSEKGAREGRQRRRSNLKPKAPKAVDGEEPAAAAIQLHPDERQIKLDTDRSFVIYPVESHLDKEKLQADLNELIVSVFRKRPKLSYFQGFHDIVTVLFLTLPKEKQLPCAEKFSLHRVRDSMGKGLEPLVGLLRVLQALLERADPELADIVKQATPLPYFALSNLLTLFSHDVPGLSQIQHIFDFLLCRNPIYVVYLAAAVIMTRKEEARILEEEGEEGMIHSLMTSLPHLKEALKEDGAGSLALLDPSVKSSGSNEDEETTLGVVDEEDLNRTSTDNLEGSTLCPSETEAEDDQKQNGLEPEIDLGQEAQLRIRNATAASSTPSSWKSSSRSPSPIRRISRPSVELSSLLAQTEDLFNRFPPNTLSLSSIMGPQSVVFTWSENPADLDDDDTAEAMATNMDLIVYPFVDLEEDQDPEKLISEKAEGKGKGRRRQGGKWVLERVDMTPGTAITGAVMLIGVGIALYQLKSSKDLPDMLDSDAQAELKQTWQWVGGALVAVGERVLSSRWLW